MAIATHCPNADCRAAFSVPSQHLGKKARCKNCGTEFRIRQGDGELISSPSSSTSLPLNLSAAVAQQAAQDHVRAPLDEAGPAKRRELGEPICSNQTAAQGSGVDEAHLPPGWNVANIVLNVYTHHARALRQSKLVSNLGNMTPLDAQAAPVDEGRASRNESAERVSSRRDAASGTGANADDVPVEWNLGDVILDLYEVTDVLGEGGMGKVFKVHHKGWNLDLAVKSPRPALLQKPGAVENFERECETWVNLGLYPHTVSCYYVRRLGGIPRVFAEYVDGGDLQTWIKDGRLYEGGPEQALQRILDIAIQFAWGLHFAHEKGLIHQDVKPANVMLTADGTAKVTDFGLAKARALAGEKPTAGQSLHSILVSVGGMTPAYCSPEQANGEKLTRKTDIWSWAVSVMEMFTGDVTWPSGTVAPEALDAYLEMGSGDERIPAMPAGLVTLLRQCFQRDPGKRPQDFEQVAATLQELYAKHCSARYSRPQPKPSELLADGLNNRGVSLLDIGKDQAAEQAFEKALQADPHHPQAVYNLGLVRWRSACITDTELVRQLQEVSTSHSEQWIDEYLLAQVHLERGDCEAAIRTVEQTGKLAQIQVELTRTLQQAREQLSTSGRCVRTFEGHVGLVRSVCLSTDGRWALSGSGDRIVRLWEVATGKCVRTFEGHMSSVHSVCLSADGRWALSGGDRTVQLWEVTAGKCVRTFEVDSLMVNSVSLSADGRWALSGGLDKTVRLWEVTTGKCVRTFAGHRAYVNSVCMSADGRWALSGSEDTTVRLWELGTGRCVRTFEEHTSRVSSVSLSTDGRWALSGSFDNTLRLWEVATGRCVRTFEGHTDWVTSVCLSADGRWALSGSGDSIVRLWEVATGKCVRTFDEHMNSVFSVCLSADGRWALSGGDRTVRVWQLPGIAPIAPAELCRISSSTEMLTSATAYRNAIAQARERLSSGDYAGALDELRQSRVQAEYSRDPVMLELWVALYVHLPRMAFRNGWETTTFEGRTGGIKSVCLSADGRWALSGSWDSIVRLWEVATGKCVRTFEGHKGVVFSVCMSGDGRWVLSGSCFGSLRLWDLSTGLCVRTFEGHSNSVFSVCLSANGRWALSGSSDKTVRLWEVATGQCVRTFKGHTHNVHSVCLSADGRWAFSGGGELGVNQSEDNTVRLWELATGECVRTFEGHKNVVTSVCLSTDGRWGLSSSQDKTIRLWEVGMGGCVRTFEGHQQNVNSVCLSADGRWALSGSSDKTVRLWEVATGKCVRTFTGHTHPVNSVCFSADGRWALSGSEDKTCKLWFLDWELEARQPADWDEGALPYLQAFCRLRAAGQNWLGKWKISEWSDEDFQQLLRTLGCAGYGWLRPEGVKKKLLKMAAKWTGPPQLPGD